MLWHGWQLCFGMRHDTMPTGKQHPVLQDMAPKLVREKTQKIELRVTPETKILVLKMAQDDEITVTRFLEGLIQREFDRRAARETDEAV